MDALLEGISKRFDRCLEDQDCQLAAAFHPKFRLYWLKKFDTNLYIRVKSAMQEAVLKEINDREIYEQEASDKSMDENNEDDFFGNVTNRNKRVVSECSAKVKSNTLVNTWLEFGSMDELSDEAFMGEQIFIKLFMKFNTGMPSSAGSERLFSEAKDIHRAKRACLTDENFERLLFLKGNNHLKDEFNFDQ